jgi:HSP20 family protein
MVVRYWQPWREIETLSRQLDNVFEELTSTATTRPDWVPAVELQDMGDSLVLRAQLPGINAKDVDLQISQKVVTISGQHHNRHQAEATSYFRSEFRYGTFHRSISLPVGIQTENVQAAYQDGVLTVTLPKIAEVRNAVVKLNLADLQDSQAANFEAAPAEMADAPAEAAQ